MRCHCYWYWCQRINFINVVFIYFFLLEFTFLIFYKFQNISCIVYVMLNPTHTPTLACYIIKLSIPISTIYRSAFASEWILLYITYRVLHLSACCRQVFCCFLFICFFSFFFFFFFFFILVRLFACLCTHCE